ncbi:MAG: phosphoribosylanthranilate isomerase [Dysgonamonadaceae bacterium]|jgi:phosphoribosylanthranilate isomerase|nr:phosphoribosylanthranilate isomerase [Dysgonamonadaceae bacterium]
MKVKVCGMKYPDNIREVSALPIDYMGFIFYEKSPRYAGDMDLSDVNFSSSILKTGVFVNESTDKISAYIDKYRLDAIQMHGCETPETCSCMQSHNVKVIKALSIEKKEDFAQCEYYADVCNYFLFDTKTPLHGGSGRQFDWNILQYYTINIPFFLSGGIGVCDAERLRAFNHPLCHGVDLNSCFETAAGQKDISLLKQFLKNIKS